MKRLSIIIIMLAAVITGWGQQIQQSDLRSHNIFAFPSFQDVKVLQPFGRFVKAKGNILLKNGAFCFEQNGKIMQANTQNILGVDFDSIKYKKIDATLMGRVIAEQKYNYLLCATTINMKQLEEETMGGTNAPFLDIVDAGQLYEIDGNSFEYDKGYPLQKKYYFMVQGKIVPANETQIKKLVRPEMKTAFKHLMEDRSWSWKDEKSLAQILGYL